MAENQYAALLSDETLENTPERVTKFLAGIGAVPEIRTLLFEKGGMTDEDLTEGVAFLMACLAAPKSKTATQDTPEAIEQRKAIAELDSSDEPLFSRTNAALQRKFPSQATYIFNELSASQGIQSVQGIATFCVRYRALEQGTDPTRKDSRTQDKEAVQFLAARRVTADDIARFEKLVQTALGPTPVLIDNLQAEATQLASSRRQRLVDLKMWFDDWAAAANSSLTKKSHKLRVGIAQRRKPTKEEKQV